METMRGCEREEGERDRRTCEDDEKVYGGGGSRMWMRRWMTRWMKEADEAIAKTTEVLASLIERFSQ